MTAKTTPSLYDHVVKITDHYLGPAADRFISRQIQNHLGKDPKRLQQKDLQELIVWIHLAMNLLVDDRDLVNRYVGDLEGIAQAEQ